MKTDQLKKKNLLFLGEPCMFYQLRYTGKMHPTIRIKPSEQRVYLELSLVLQLVLAIRLDLKTIFNHWIQVYYLFAELPVLSLDLFQQLAPQLCLCKSILPKFIRKSIKHRQRAKSCILGHFCKMFSSCFPIIKKK